MCSGQSLRRVGGSSGQFRTSGENNSHDGRPGDKQEHKRQEVDLRLHQARAANGEKIHRPEETDPLQQHGRNKHHVNGCSRGPVGEDVRRNALIGGLDVVFVRVEAGQGNRAHDNGSHGPTRRPLVYCCAKREADEKAWLRQQT